MPRRQAPGWLRSHRRWNCWRQLPQIPLQGLVPLSVVKDKIAKIRAGAQKLDAGGAARQAGAGAAQLTRAPDSSMQEQGG